MTVKNIAKFLGVVALLLLFTTCSKRTENLIVGEWLVENTGQPAFPSDATWIFYDDGRLEVINDLNARPDDMSRFEWTAFSRSVVTPYIELGGNKDQDHINPKAGMNGKWRVETLNAAILVITRVEFLDGNISGAFLRREFTRK